MYKLFAFLLLIWSFFNPYIASIIYIIFIVLFEGYLWFSHLFMKPKKIDTSSFTLSEQDILKKYHLYFRFPFTSKGLSSTLSGIQISSFLWVPWLLYNKLWLQAIIIGLNYFYTAPLAVKLNPRYFLHDAVEIRGKDELLSEMLIVDSICDKIIEKQREKRKKYKMKKDI